MVRLPQIPNRAAIVAPFASKEAFVKFIQVSEDDEKETSFGTSRWSNKDLEPTPKASRSWTW